MNDRAIHAGAGRLDRAATKLPVLPRADSWHAPEAT
jgi:hypothetical protein